MISKEDVVLVILLKKRMIRQNAKAPIIAMLTKPIPLDIKVIPVIVESATNKLDPLLIPKMEGPASGFEKKVCMRSPETDKPAPAKRQVIVLGSRISFNKIKSFSDKDEVNKLLKSDMFSPENRWIIERESNNRISRKLEENKRILF
jgi:hypothetical protein